MPDRSNFREKNMLHRVFRLIENHGHRMAAHLLALALVAGTSFAAGTSDHMRPSSAREGATMTDSSEPSSPATQSPAGTSTIEDQKSVAITVYNSNIGLVKDTRTIRLPRGNSLLRFMDVAQQINPATVHIKSLTAPNALDVIEQNYEYDLLNPAKLLDKYVGREVTLVLRTFENNTEKLTPTRATLLSNNSGQVWQIANQTLVWSLNNTGADSHTVEASYLTTGIGWRADYVVVVNKDDTKADLNGWVTINNNTGAAYRNAELKLVAGDINRVQEQDQLALRRAGRAEMAQAAPAPQFQEQAFFEYHLYTLQRPATLKNNETKQISLLSAANFNVKKELVLNGQQYYYQGYNNPGEAIKEKVGVYVEFKNNKESNLGQPLPAGIVRVYKAD